MKFKRTTPVNLGCICYKVSLTVELVLGLPSFFRLLFFQSLGQQLVILHLFDHSLLGEPFSVIGLLVAKDFDHFSREVSNLTAELVVSEK